MARRKKEPQNVHRKNISTDAEQLFMKKDIENTLINEIAKEAGYSKATLYVYFKNKEELIGVLVLESMEKLQKYIRLALEQGNNKEIILCNDMRKSVTHWCNMKNGNFIQYKI